MPTYTLRTAFTQQDLERFYATGTNIVVAKPNGGGAPNVAWIVFRPLIDNSMTWTDEYGIYASNTDLIAGAVLSQMSKTGYPAEPAKMYELAPAGAFVGPGSNTPAGSYTALNSYDNLPKGYLTFGLYQRAEVNGSRVDANAVSAAPVLYGSTAQITPFTTVYLWTQSSVVGNSVITTVTSEQTIVTFGGSVTQVSLRYDATTGKFVPASPAAMEEGLALDYKDPSL
jgi:hypothetical protein